MLLSDVVSLLTQEGWGIIPGPHAIHAATGANTLQNFDRDKANRFPQVLKLASGPGLKFPRRHAAQPESS
jgi:hypothetical protein